MRFIELSAPKLRRYFSFKTLLLPFTFTTAFFRAFYMLKRERPSIVISAEGYTSVPVHLAAWLLRIVAFVHQQDVVVGLTNKIIAPKATSVSCAFKESLAHLPKGAMCIGNPVDAGVLQGDAEKDLKVFDLEKNTPIILVLGGGVGAVQINELVWNALPEITQFAQIIHSTGANKGRTMKAQRYHQYPLISREDMAHAYAVADLVVARAGMGTLSELSALGKKVFLMPIPNSHQEKNAEVFVKAGFARLLNEENKDQFVSLLKQTLESKAATKSPLRTDTGDRLAQMVLYGLSRIAKKK